jgi:hypothetical protein
MSIAQKALALCDLALVDLQLTEGIEELGALTPSVECRCECASHPKSSLCSEERAEPSAS